MWQEESKLLERLKVNPNVFLPLDIEAEDLEQLKKDEEHVRSIARFMWDKVRVLPSPCLPLALDLNGMGAHWWYLTPMTLATYAQCIPNFLDEVKRGNLSPIDGEMLTDNLHQTGINMRYLGRCLTPKLLQHSLC